MRFKGKATVRGKGLAIGIEVNNEAYASEVGDACRENGLLVSAEADVLMLFPASRTPPGSDQRLVIDLLGLFGSLFISHPWLALVPAIGFAGLFRWGRRKVAGVAAAAWLVYALWEYALSRRWLCSGECNIRVDLLLIYPALLIVSLVALAVAIRAAAHRKGAQGG